MEQPPQRKFGMNFDTTDRKLSRHETHDLSMIIKDRAKVLKAHVAEQAAAFMQEFETKLATIYSFDQDEVWKKATERAMKVVAESQAEIAKQCEKLGIPRQFAPTISASWQGRGENMLASRRAELRRVAKATVEAMSRTAETRIEKQGLDLRTQVVAMGLLSHDAKLFLESLAPVEETMKSLDFREMERKLDSETSEQRRQRRLPGIDYG